MTRLKECTYCLRRGRTPNRLDIERHTKPLTGGSISNSETRAGTYNSLFSSTPVQAARIKLVVDGATGQDDVPTRMEFHVAADGGGNAAAVAILRSSSFDMDGSVIADHFTETTYTLSGTTPSLNPANGGIQKWTLTANSTPTDGLTDGESMLLQVTDGTAYTITWPTISWVGGSAPTLDATDETIIELWKVSTTLYGALVGVA